MKATTKATIVMLALATPMLCAAKGTITFKGRVVSQTTYEATVNGQSNGVVQLPTADLSAELTPVNIVLKRKAQETGKVSTTFVSRHVTDNGNLKNIAKGEQAAVQVQLLNQDRDGKPVQLGAASQTRVPGDKTQTFAVRYVAEHGAAATGAVTAMVEYTVTYL